MGIKKIVIAAVLFSAVTAAFIGYRKSTRNAVDKLISSKQLVSILICGGNKFNKNKNRFNSILVVNPDTKRAGVVFLPPNLEIDLEDDGNGVKMENIDIRDFKDMSKALFKSIKIRPQFYSVFYAPDARRIADIIEGLTMFFPEPSESVFGSVYGMNYLDGSKTIKFINGTGGSIYYKYDRLQDIVLTLFEQRSAYSNFMTKAVISELCSTLTTNMQPNEALSIARILSECDEISCINLPGRVSDEGSFFCDEITFKMYEDMFLRWLIVKEKTPPNIRVKILNATDVPGLAKRVRNSLMREGVSVIEFGTHRINDLQESAIINNKGNNNDVKMVSELTGIKNIYHSVDSTQVYDLTILVGKDMVK